jgi:ribulose-5-phosphate 4-epimerase/fuculose-1-phosphate aldolase
MMIVPGGYPPSRSRLSPVIPVDRFFGFAAIGTSVIVVLGQIHQKHNMSGCHLKNHGVLLTGRSIEEAVINAVWLEMQAKMTLLTTMIGTPSPQTPEEVQLNIEQADPITGRWNYYVSLLDLPYVTI